MGNYSEGTATLPNCGSPETCKVPLAVFCRGCLFYDLGHVGRGLGEGLSRDGEARQSSIWVVTGTRTTDKDKPCLDLRLS